VVEAHPEGVPLLAHLDVEPAGQRVDDRRADAVQTAGHLVAAAAELAAGMQLGEHELDRADALGRVDVGGDAAPVVAHPHAAVGLQRDVDGVGIPGQGLVDRVVDDLPDEVVQAALAGGPDVHAGPLADGLQPLEHGDRRRRRMPSRQPSVGVGGARGGGVDHGAPVGSADGLPDGPGARRHEVMPTAAAFVAPSAAVRTSF
jgi:hypothetical protein